MRFPANPSDKMVYQVRQGLSYIYEAATGSWINIAGGEIFPLATPLKSGLMAAVDLYKVNRFIAPVIRSTIRGDGCSGAFSSGYIDIYGVDGYVNVDGTRQLDGAGSYQFRITKNTAGIDFTINMDALISTLLESGQISILGPAGEKGPTGPKGPTGRSLPVGPQGPIGDPGVSQPCTISISQESSANIVNGSLNKAVVGLVTEQRGNEYVIIAQRGVVGNPSAAPSLVNARCGDQSTWVLATTGSGGAAQSVFYVDLQYVLAAVLDKFNSEVSRVKKGYEDVVTFWLNTMTTSFIQQKATLCCAITDCTTTT